MKTKNIGSPKSILALVVVMVTGWAVICNAFEYEQWDAKATARVNLRSRPSTKGAILSVIPKGHKVTVTEKKGFWCKVDAEGEIHGKGWVYGEYLSRILPKALQTESSRQFVRVPIAVGEPKQGSHPAEPPPKSRAEEEEQKSLRAPLPEKTSISAVKEQSSGKSDLMEMKNDADTLSGVEISLTAEPPYIVAAQEPPAGRVEDGKTMSLNASMPAKAPKARLNEPVWVRNKIREAQTDTYQKYNSGEKKKHTGALQETPPAFSEHFIPDVRAAASSLIKSTISHETKGLINKSGSMGARPIEIALKLMSIVLSCLAVLLLYKGNLRYQTLNVASLIHYSKFDISSLLKKFTSRAQKLA